MATVLLVDDDAAARATLRGFLAREGYALHLAENGAQALAMAREHLPDVILLDVMMPGMDGFEVTRALKASPETAPIPVILVTALDSRDDIVRGLDAGAEEYVAKPVNGVELRARVRSMLRIKTLYDALNRERDALAAAQAERRQLSAFVVHDMKNAVGGLLANAQYLLDCPALTGDYHDAASDVVTAVSFLDRLSRNLLDIYRDETGQMRIRKAACDAGAIAMACVHGLARRAKLNGHELRCDAGPVPLQADPDHVRRIIENLADNAIKYATPDTPIRVSAAPGEGGAILRVSDCGPRLPEAMRERIFDSYSTLDPVTQEAVKGTRGLGLVFCRVSAKAHGGRVWVEDSPEGGNAFCVALPGGGEEVT